MTPSDPSAPEDPLAQAQAEAARLRAENARLSELLDMAQEFGRLGVWERDPKTLEGRWDAHVFRFYGYDVSDGRTPSFSEATRRVHPDDRLEANFLASLKVPGAHSQRYRIVRPDGSVRFMHSQWRVIAGRDGGAERVVGVLLDDTESRALADEAAAATTQLELALSLSDIGLWRYEFATGRVHYDLRAQSILGRSMGAEGVPLDTVRSWIHPDDVADIQAAFATALDSDRPVDTQTRYRHADGSWRTILTRRVVQRDATGRPTAMVGVGLDVTEQQRRTIEALQLSQRLEEAAEAARVGLWSGALDGSAPQWNARMHALLGHDPSEGPLRIGDALRRFAHPQDRERVAEQALAWLRGPSGQPLDLELRILRGDGEVRWMQMRGHQQVDGDGQRRAFGVMFDVTEQRDALDGLRAASERVRLALSSVGMGTWTHDLATGQDLWDEQMFRLRGLEPSPAALDETQRLAMVLPEDLATLEAVNRPLRDSAEPLGYEFRIVRTDGQVRTLASRSIAVLDEAGRVRQRIGVNWDVTEARALERAARERELALRESRARSALLSRVSHELRTPLNAVLGFTQLMLSPGGDDDPKQRQRWLRRIQEAGQGLLALVDGVLALNEIADEPAPTAAQAVALSPVIDRVLAALSSEIARRALSVQRHEGSLAVHADERRLQQAMAQLVGNAVKFNRSGGAVRIAARTEGDEVAIEVGDEGPGVPAAVAERLFEPFGGSANGRGIGLAIAQAIAAHLGGRIRLVRSDAQGSVFELRLPQARPAPTDAPAAGRPEHRPTVLYIEDNDVNMLIVRELLSQRSDIAFEGAVNGSIGVDRARELRPALVLVDMQLPDIDGLEVLRRLRADPATAHLPCVAVSANAMPEDVQRARAAGFDDYWTKPIDLGAFLMALDRWVPQPQSA